MILKQNSRAQNFISIFLLVKKGEVVSQPFEKNVKFSAPSAFLESPASSVGVVGSLVVQLHGSQRYVLNCTPVRSNGGVSNFYEKDRQRDRGR